MQFAWSAKLSVGVEKIDEQLRELFQRVDGLLMALASRGGAGEIFRALGALSESLVSHSNEEERLMKESRYPGLDDQRSQHAQLVQLLEHMSLEFARGGAGAAPAWALLQDLCTRLREHVAVSDAAFGKWLTEHGTRAA
jgi:hemerythrin-like metal-binding protein